MLWFMSVKPSDSEEGGFQHKPLAGLAGLRSRFPSTESSESAETPDPSSTALPGPDASPASSDETELGAKLVVQRERKKRGGKTVTRIRGLEVDARVRKELAKQLAKALGCGSSVEDADILLQGAQVERAADWLERRGASPVIRGN